MSVLSRPHFHDEEAAFSFLEDIIWSDGPVCPRCGETDRIGKIKANPVRRVRHGLWKCGPCNRQFTVKIRTVFEHMRIPLHKALQAVHLMCSSKKGISAHQMHRILEVTYKTAWFLEHRIREAMRDGSLSKMGGPGKTVEADETFIGKKYDKPEGARGYAHKEAVLSLVERGGEVRSRHVASVNAETLRPILAKQLDAGTALMTDEAKQYGPIGKGYAKHEKVNHSAGEYVRGDAHTNTIEGYFSIFKRGMKGIYQHCSSKHLKRYLCEFDFRYNNRSAQGIEDVERTELALAGIVGKRLLYRDSSIG